MAATFTRRTVIGGLLAAPACVLVGCGQSARQNSKNATSAPPQPAASAQPAAMVVYRDPSCGCCGAWAEIARQAGYRVRLIDHPDMPSIKRQYGVPEELLSCHTAIVGGYAVEGHVPLEDVKRLLTVRPGGVRGIGVPGMPLGSPGMETPDGTRQPFEVMAFDAGGKTSVFDG